jgi:oligoendopeptidase F
LEGLIKKLELGDKATVESARAKLKQLETEKKNASTKLATTGAEYHRALQRVRKELREIWPELQTNYSPLAMSLASERGDEFTKRVESLASYAAMCKAKDLREERSTKYYDAARKIAKLQRLLRTAENVVLAANLPNVATPDIVARYEKLRAAEEGALTPPTQAVSAKKEN